MTEINGKIRSHLEYITEMTTTIEMSAVNDKMETAGSFLFYLKGIFISI